MKPFALFLITIGLAFACAGKPVTALCWLAAAAVAAWLYKKQ